MKTLRQVNIKNCPNYLFNSMTNIKNLDTNLLGINQISFTNTDSVVNEYFKNLDGINSLYFIFNNVDAYFECIDENKYLLFTFAKQKQRSIRKLQKNLE